MHHPSHISVQTKVCCGSYWGVKSRALASRRPNPMNHHVESGGILRKNKSLAISRPSLIFLRWLQREMLWQNYFWCVYIQVSSTGSSKQRSPSSWSALSIASDYTSPTRLPVFTPQLSNWFPCAWPGTKDFSGISIDQDTLRIHAPVDILRCVFPQFSCDYVKQSHLFPTQLHDVFPTALRIFRRFQTLKQRILD